MITLSYQIENGFVNIARSVNPRDLLASQNILKEETQEFGWLNERGDGGCEVYEAFRVIMSLNDIIIYNYILINLFYLDFFHYICDMKLIFKDIRKDIILLKVEYDITFLNKSLFLHKRIS